MASQETAQEPEKGLPAGSSTHSESTDAHTGTDPVIATAPFTQSDKSTTLATNTTPEHSYHYPPTATPQPDPYSTFPEGGPKAWLTVLGCFCCFTVTFGWLQSVGVYQAHYELYELSNYTHDEIAWILSLEAYCLFAGGLFVGPAHDKYGPKFLLWGGTFLHAFGVFMASLATKYYQFILSQGLCSGIGTAMLFYPSVSCTMTWFREKRGVAVGLAASGSGIGGVIFPLIVREMIDDIGFGWTMRTCAFLILFLGTVASLVTTSRLPPTPKKATLDDLKACFKDVVYCLVVAAGSTGFIGLWVVFTFIVSTAITRDLTPSFAFYLVPLLNTGSVFGRIIPGILADYTGAMNMYVIIATFTFLVMTCLWIPVSGTAGMVIFSLLFGFGSGALNMLSPVVLGQISDVKSLGLRTGLCYTFTGIGCLFASPAGGAIIEASGYRAMQGFAGAIAGLAAILAMVTRWRVKGFAWAKV